MGLKHHHYGQVKNWKRASAEYQARWAEEDGGEEREKQVRK